MGQRGFCALNRTIILRTEAIRAAAVAAVSHLPTDQDHPLEVVIRPHKATRRLEQNALYWVRLGEIADQAYIGGRLYDAETLHAWCKREFLPDVTSRGTAKWIVLPNGERVLNMSTGDLNVSEFADYLTQVEAWGAGLGVMFSA